MYKRIDEDYTEAIEGFSYSNCKDNIEIVNIQGDWVNFLNDSLETMTDIYIEDIPKLILALQAVYDLTQKDAI